MTSVTDLLDRYGLTGPTGAADEWVAAPPDLPVRVLRAVTDSVSDLDDVWWGSRPPGVLLAAMRSLEELRSVLDNVELSLVTEIDATGAAKTEGWASTKDYLTAVTGGFRERDAARWRWPGR